MYLIKKFKLVSSLILGATLYTNNVNAHCDFHFNYGVIIDPAHIRILEQGITYVQITNQGQIFLKGRVIPLNANQQALINQYATGIRSQIPELVNIAIEGVDIGLKAVNKVVASLTGENSASHQKLQKRFEELHWRIRKRFNHSDENYFIAPQDLDDFDEIFAGQFEQEIEEIVTDSIGTILYAVGEAVTNQEIASDGNEQRAGSVADQVDAMSDDLVQELKLKTNQIETKTDAFCSKLIALNNIENNIQDQISALKNFNLIESNH